MPKNNGVINTNPRINYKKIKYKTKHNKKSINGPVNKSLDEIIRKRLVSKSKSFGSFNNTLSGVSVVLCTMRPSNIENALNNYLRQTYTEKELILILNSDEMDINEVKDKVTQFENIKIYKLNESITLGECLNFGVEQSNYPVIAKFDDDDYYGPKYLEDSMEEFASTKAKVIGKKASFVYFENYLTLAIRNPKRENCYVNHMDGPTLMIRKDVFNTVRFAHIPSGVDTQFTRDCIKNGIRIYSINKYHHVYIRHASVSQHTWKISNVKLLKMCKIVATNISNFTSYVDK